MKKKFVKTQVPPAQRINLNFGEALQLLKAGIHVTRTGWNGKGMWLVYVTADGWEDAVILGEFGLKSGLPFIAMKTVDNNLVPWPASQTDMLANDWQQFDPAGVLPELPAQPEYCPHCGWRHDDDVPASEAPVNLSHTLTHAVMEWLTAARDRLNEAPFDPAAAAARFEIDAFMDVCLNRGPCV